MTVRAYLSAPSARVLPTDLRTSVPIRHIWNLVEIAIVMDMGVSAAAGFLAKLAGGAAATKFRSLLENKSQRRRISGRTSKRARKQSVDIEPKIIRAWLADAGVQRYLLSGESQALVEAVKLLAHEMTGTDEARVQDAIIVLEIACEEFLLAVSPQQAASATATRTQELVIATSRGTNEKLDAGFDRLMEQLGPSQIFAEDLRRLQAWRAEEADALAGEWPPIQNLVHALVLSHDRASTLDAWRTATPPELEKAPGAAWCWLGLFADDHGRRESAVAFVRRGIDMGVADVDYWLARLALMSDDVHAQPATADEQDAQVPSNHPLSEAIRALRSERWDAAERSLSDWESASRNDAALKSLLRAQAAQGQDEHDRAISILHDTCAQLPEASGVRLILAELLLSRGYRGRTVSRQADYVRALELALQARDTRRQWGGDSSAAVVVAIKASVLSGDTNRTWELTQHGDAGDATVSEASDPRIRQEAAVLAAMTGRVAEATNLLAGLRDPYTEEFVAGHLAAYAEHDAEAEAHWLSAWELAPDSRAQLQIARSLAPLGGALPNIDPLSSEFEEHVAEIRAIHDVMASTPGQRLTKLRAHAHEFEQIAVLLGQELSSLGELAEAAIVLTDAAERWDHPLLMKMSADRYAHAGDYGAAVEACRRAYTMAGSEWPGELETRAIEFRALDALGRDGEQLEVARRMTALAPDNDDARWALVNCLGRRGEPTAAFGALTRNGRPIRPRTADEAKNWIRLLSEADDSPHFLPRALDELNEWRDNEDVAGVFLTVLMFGRPVASDDENGSHVSRLRELTREYVDRFPESRVFREVTFDPDDPLQGIAELLQGPPDPVLEELHQKITTAQLPIGLASEISGRSYAEIVINRASGLVFSNPAGTTRSTAHERLDDAGSGAVVLDTTAAVSLGALPAAIRDTLMARFARIETTAAAFRDARLAQQSLALRSTAGVAWEPGQERPHVYEVSIELAEARAARATDLVETLTRTHRREWRVTKFEQLEMDGAWLSAVDFAITHELPFWCDDLVLASIARQLGCQSFSTVDFVTASEESGVLTLDESLTAKASLVRDFHVALEFDPAVFDLAASMDDWDAGGAATTLTLPDTWMGREPVLEFFHRGTEQNAERSEAALSGWITAAAVGFGRLETTPEARGHNLALLLGSIIGRPWMTPARLPTVVRAVRVATRHLAANDPLHDALAFMHELAANEFGDSAAAYLLLHWARHLERPDKHEATMIAARGRQ